MPERQPCSMPGKVNPGRGARGHMMMVRTQASPRRCRGARGHLGHLLNAARAGHDFLHSAHPRRRSRERHRVEGRELNRERIDIEYLACR